MTYSDCCIKTGKNASENWELIVKSDKNSVWFHLTSFSSPHTVLNMLYGEIPNKEHIITASNICKAASKQRNTRNIYISYTPISNLKKGPEIGSVIFISNKLVQRIKI